MAQFHLNQNNRHPPEYDYLLDQDHDQKFGMQEEMLADHQEKEFSVKSGALYSFVIVLTFATSLMGYFFTSNNQVAPILAIQFGWAPNEATIDYYNSKVSASPVLGAAIGSYIGGSIMGMGRRKTLLVFNIIAAGGIACTIISNVWFIIAGRLIVGICIGVFGCVVPRIIEETVPTHMLGTFGTFTNLSINFGSMVTMLLAAGLPPTDNVQACKDTTFWKFIFVFPLAIVATQLFIFTFIIREDSIRFSVQNGNYDSALKLIKKFYREDPYQVLKQYQRGIQKSRSQQKSGQQKREASVIKVLFGQDYWRATWLCIALVFFNQAVGINVILFYSNTILQKMNQMDKNFPISARQGTYLVGIVNFASSVIAIYPIEKFGRKSLLLMGHGLMVICLSLIGIFQVYDMGLTVVSMMLLYLLIFQCSQGPLAWLYTSEVVADAALGICILFLMTFAFLVSLLTPTAIECLTTPGVFWLLATFSAIGGIFLLIFMKETKGLTDHQKKNLYCDKYQ